MESVREKSEETIPASPIRFMGRGSHCKDGHGEGNERPGCREMVYNYANRHRDFWFSFVDLRCTQFGTSGRDGTLVPPAGGDGVSAEKRKQNELGRFRSAEIEVSA